MKHRSFVSDLCTGLTGVIRLTLAVWDWMARVCPQTSSLRNWAGQMLSPWTLRLTVCGGQMLIWISQSQLKIASFLFASVNVVKLLIMLLCYFIWISWSAEKCFLFFLQSIVTLFKPVFSLLFPAPINAFSSCTHSDNFDTEFIKINKNQK